MTTRTRRRGYTLFELIAVMAVLVILAVIILPSVSAFRGDTRQRAAADVIRTELKIARARAKEEGRPYRVAISQDGTRIRRAPEADDFASVSAFDHAAGSAAAVDYPFEYAKAQVVAEQDATPPTSGDGWVTIATALPDGTCREVSVLVSLTEDDRGPIYLRIRGLTGSSRIVPAPNGGSR